MKIYKITEASEYLGGLKGAALCLNYLTLVVEYIKLNAMNKAPTKTEVLDALDINQAELARRLGVTRSAVCQWPDGEPIPLVQWLRLKYELAPQVFAGQGEPRQEAA